MSFTEIENTPIFIDLTQAALSTGWSVSGTQASHESCNDGNLILNNYTLTIGQTYRYSYQIISIASGYVQASLGAAQTTPGFVVESGVAAATQFSFYANGVCTIELFSIELVAAITTQDAQNTIAFNEPMNKWSSFYSYIPDNAFSIYTRLYSFYQGDAYVHEAGTNERCNFYGVQYFPSINISTNEQPTRLKTFLGLNYQCNQLLLAPSVSTSLNQQSKLLSGNFLQAQYNDGTLIYDIEGLYKASFLRDMNVDLINGDPLKGNWMELYLVGTSPSTPLQLYTTEVTYAHSAQGIR